MLDIHTINIEKKMFFYKFYVILWLVMKITKKRNAKKGIPLRIT